MRYDAEHKQKTRTKVLEVAAKAIRTEGPDRIGVAGEKVVQGDRKVARLRQRLAGMRADIAGPAGDQDRFHRAGSRKRLGNSRLQGLCRAFQPRAL